MMRPVTVTLDDELYSSIEELAGRSGRPVEELTRELVGEGVRSRARAAAQDALRGIADANRDPLDDDSAVALVAEEVRQIRAERRDQGRS
ncbi:MAG: ribbon-helix-helix protein, CopG family [Thermoleophilia bacterium]|nr:ribbon-helix-helix protein, CopG family [Thermoleophilia bacterium]